MAVRRTIPHLADAVRQRFPTSRVAFHRPEGGRFVPVTWGESVDFANELGCGLHDLGLRKGDKAAILADTRFEWTALDIAILGLGGVTVGIYPTSTPEQIRYILDHSGSRLVVVENMGMLEVVQGMRGELSELEHVVVIDAPGKKGEGWQSLDALRASGKGVLEADPDLLERCLDEVEPEDVAILVYTSGTTGPPKGVVLCHGALYDIAHRSSEALGLSEDDVGVVFLPLAHSLQRVAGYTGLSAGTTGYYAESIQKLPEVWQAAQPTTVGSVPRIFEKMHAKIMNGLSEQPERRQRIFERAIALGKRRSRHLQRGEPVPWHVELRYKLADKIIFQKIKARSFGTRVRFLVSGGAPISLELLEFFHAMGLLILEGYGLTETSAPATVNRPEAFKFGTVGQALPGVEIKIAEDGEILIRGPGNLKAYYKDPEATAAAIDPEGWFYSGDIGALDSEGFLKITDRKKDIIITAGGKNIAPQNIENLVKTDPHISQLMVHGDRRKYLVALVTLDPEEMATWSRKNLGEEVPMAALVEREEVRALVEGLIEARNSTLARYETIKKFRLLAEDFTVEAGTLTPTLKVKRRVIEAKYKDLIEGMYE